MSEPHSDPCQLSCQANHGACAPRAREGISPCDRAVGRACWFDSTARLMLRRAAFGLLRPPSRTARKANAGLVAPPFAAADKRTQEPHVRMAREGHFSTLRTCVRAFSLAAALAIALAQRLPQTKSRRTPCPDDEPLKKHTQPDVFEDGIVGERIAARAGVITPPFKHGRPQQVKPCALCGTPEAARNRERSAGKRYLGLGLGVHL